MDVIRVLLRSSLLTELGDDEERVGFVRRAVKDLAADLAGESRALVPYAVVAAIDESTLATATPIAKAEQAVLGNWETFRNAFPGLPIEVLRAVALAAVADVTGRDEALGHAAWYAVRTASECLPAGRWGAAVKDLVIEWGTAVSRSIAATWTPPAASSKLRMPAIPKVEDERITSETTLRDRAKELGPPNQFMQQLHGRYAEHVDQLVGVSEVLAAEAYRRSIAHLKDFVAELGSRLREGIAAQEQTIEAVRLRTELLWWRQTAFSARLSVPYGELGSADLAIAAAVDIHELVPPIAPLAVEHLLANLVHDTVGDTSLTTKALTAADQVRALPVATGHTPATLVDAIHGGAEAPVVRKALPASRAAVLLFRDLQARRLAATGTPRQPSEGA